MIHIHVFRFSVRNNLNRYQIDIDNPNGNSILIRCLIGY